MEKIIKYLNIRRRKLLLAKEQIKFRDRATGKTKTIINERISAKLSEVLGMLERLKTIGIDKMIVVAEEDYQKRKEKKVSDIMEKQTIKDIKHDEK